VRKDILRANGVKKGNAESVPARQATESAHSVTALRVQPKDIAQVAKRDLSSMAECQQTLKDARYQKLAHQFFIVWKTSQELCQRNARNVRKDILQVNGARKGHAEFAPLPRAGVKHVLPKDIANLAKQDISSTVLLRHTSKGALRRMRSDGMFVIFWLPTNVDRNLLDNIVQT